MWPWRNFATAFASNAHDTRSRNRRHKSTLFFSGADYGTVWYRISHCILLWYQIAAPITTLFYNSKPKSGVYVTDMMTGDWRMIIVHVFMCCEVVVCFAVIYLFIYLIFLAMFIFGTRNFHSRRTLNVKPALENGVDLWRRSLDPVSWN